MFRMVFIVMPVAVVLAGCGTQSPEAKTAPVENQQPEAAASGTHFDAARLAEKLKFKDVDGQSVFSVKPQSDGAKIVDAAENELARLKIDEDRIRVKGPQEQALAQLKGDRTRIDLRSADGEQPLWKLQRSDDGDWKLKDVEEKTIYRIKQRDYGFEVQDAVQRTVCKVKQKDSKISLRDHSEATVLSTNNSVSLLAVTCLGFEAMESDVQRRAMMTAVVLSGAE